MPQHRATIPASLFLAVLFAVSLPAAENEILHLSGTGYGDTVDWGFFVTEGRRAGQWTTIPVPSQWELEGFGRYNYGHDEDKSREVGRYRHRFRLPPEWNEKWRGERIELVFEGVMTDAVVTLNGLAAGVEHRGAFYRFRYDVTDLVDLTGENLLEVEVRKQSSEKSVNRAERDADYWVFGGIYRPVYLEASPRESIRHAAIDARHNGALRAVVDLRQIAAASAVEGRVTTLDGEPVGEPFSAAVAAGDQGCELSASIPGIEPWSAEHPHLYRLELVLVRDGEILHHHAERIGFRTVEVRQGEGLFVNQRRVRLKGVNRHAFWPNSGRTLNAKIDYRDAELMKAMNMNAVRASHYPPDPSFLAAADELGLYVINELAGWHDAYATPVGRPLVREMVERDVNHPAIIFWANGNEGGWNDALDASFTEHDPQRRIVLHPDDPLGGFETAHYPDFEVLADFLAEGRLNYLLHPRWWPDPPPLVMPTEFLHGLYGGGSGASLEEYWRLITSSPRGVGGFLWSFSDESVVRTDRGGALDSDGNHAPDGILGPYREISEGFHAVRAAFAPVRVTSAFVNVEGRVRLENRFDMTDLAACRVRWAWLRLPGPDEAGAMLDVLEAGERPGPATGPGETGEMRLPPPGEEAGALRLVVVDPHDREVMTEVLRLHRRQTYAEVWTGGEGTTEAAADGERLILRAAGASAHFEVADGLRITLERGGRRVVFDGVAPLPKLGSLSLERVSEEVLARWGSGNESWARFEILPSGWLRVLYQFWPDAAYADFYGLHFPYPAERVMSFEWLGRGPGRVWKNRRQGGVLGLWRKERAAEAPPEEAWGSELAGFYADVHWGRVTTTDAELTFVLSDQPGRGLDLGVLSPEFPADAEEAKAAVPPQGFSILNGISAIGTKFKRPEELGLEGGEHRNLEIFGGVFWLRIGG